MPTRNCDGCGDAYTRSATHLGKFCSATCAHASKVKSKPTYRRVRRASAHPLATPSGYVAEARAVLYEKIGPGPHACHWCGRTPLVWVIGKKGHADGAVITDHVDGDKHNDDPANLVPACGGCNGSRWHRVVDTENFRVRTNGTRLRGEPRRCEACQEEFVAWDTTRGRGRFCSRSCARTAPKNYERL